MSDALLLSLVGAALLRPFALALWAMTRGDCRKGGHCEWHRTDRFRERQGAKCKRRQFLMREWEDY
jgi:hypothetical protein